MQHDLLSGLKEHRLSKIVAIGHSMGAIGSILAAIQEPELFRALILLDPTMFNPTTMQVFAALRWLKGMGAPVPMPRVGGALRRRVNFVDHESAFRYFREKPLFRDWLDDSLRDYVNSALIPAGSEGHRLAWPPEWEARYFETVETGIWGDLRKLDRRIPVLVIYGGKSEAFWRSTARAFGNRVPWAELIELPGKGHLFPMSAPGECARMISSFVRAGWRSTISRD